MTYVPVPLPEGTESLSHSRRTDFNVCRRLYFYKHELGLKPIDTPPPLRMGAILGTGIELRDPLAAWNAYSELITEAIGDQRQDLVDTLLHEQLVVDAAVRSKLAREDITDNMVPEVVFVGKQAAGFADNGRFDEVAETPSGILIVERKFKTYFSGSWIEELTMDDQLSSYIANAMQTYDVQLKDVYVQYEVIWKPRIRKTQKDSTPEIWRKRSADWYTLKPDDAHTILLPGERVLERNAQQLSDWWDRFERMANQIHMERSIAAEGKLEAWPQHPNSCFRFNRPCEFINLCTAATPEEWQGAAKAGFSTREERAAKRRLLDQVAEVE